MEVIVNNCAIARGEVVVVKGNLGVRIQQVISRQQRVTTLISFGSLALRGLALAAAPILYLSLRRELRKTLREQRDKGPRSEQKFMTSAQSFKRWMQSFKNWRPRLRNPLQCHGSRRPST